MRFLFCSLDSLGFLHPAIGVAKVLSSRGHEVKFVTNLPHGDLLASLGFERLPRGPNDGTSFQVAQWGDPFSIAIQVKHIEHALSLFPADALVGQSLTYGSLIVAARHEVPVGLLGFCTYLWPVTGPDDGDGEPLNISIHSSVKDWRTWRHRGMLETYNKARSLFRLAPCRNNWRDTPLLGDLFLLQSIPELEPSWEDLPEQVHLVGTCLWEPEEAEPELDRWLTDSVRGGAPVIYVQHGRSFHIPSFWRGLVEALAESRCRVAASVGRLDSDVGTLPESFFVRPHIPQGTVLRYARVAVASANTTAVLGSLAAGVPSLLIPAGGEQPDVAALCRSAKIARTLLPQEATAERIGAEIRVLLDDPCYREHALLYASAFARMNGPERAADLLETLARTRRPVYRTSATCLERTA
jgi:UDP:flavonoid glycosyltransferase YjiC (YdhE family)